MWEIGIIGLKGNRRHCDLAARRRHRVGYLDLTNVSSPVVENELKGLVIGILTIANTVWFTHVLLFLLFLHFNLVGMRRNVLGLVWESNYGFYEMRLDGFCLKQRDSRFRYLGETNWLDDNYNIYSVLEYL